MMPAEHLPDLIERLPVVRGELAADVPLARYTWFKTGGPAEVLFRPEDANDLASFMANLSEDVPITVLGNASNLLIRDGGIDGVVIRLGRGFSGIEIDGLNIIAGAAAADLNVARRARDAGIAGLEFLSGVPGTIGGAVNMNAGAYGAEISDVFVEASIIARNGHQKVITSKDLDFSYRHAGLGVGDIITDVRLSGAKGNSDEIAKRMAEIQQQRETTQPVKMLTGGSTFKNPDGKKAWALIDAAGCRGLRRGHAVVSELHCNFMVNEGGATASDLEGLGEDVRRRVEANSGVVLEWEIRRVGRPVDGQISEVTP